MYSKFDFFLKYIQLELLKIKLFLEILTKKQNTSRCKLKVLVDTNQPKHMRKFQIFTTNYSKNLLIMARPEGVLPDLGVLVGVRGDVGNSLSG